MRRPPDHLRSAPAPGAPDACPPSAPPVPAHLVLVPPALALVALAAMAFGLDGRLAALSFDPAAHAFPWRHGIALELFGHRLAKSGVWAIWLLLLGAALVSPLVERLARHRAVLWTTVAAMAAGPILVVALKNLTAFHCPWDLKAFGGDADAIVAIFVRPAQAGRCFPSGHAAGGFSLIALHLAGIASGDRRLRALGLWTAVLAGSAFGLVRMTQGAHFLSHNLWAAAIDWTAATLVFVPLLAARARCRGPSGPPA